MQKYGISDTLLNRHIGSESLRSRMQPKEETLLDLTQVSTHHGSIKE